MEREENIVEEGERGEKKREGRVEGRNIIRGGSSTASLSRRKRKLANFGETFVQ